MSGHRMIGNLFFTCTVDAGAIVVAATCRHGEMQSCAQEDRAGEAEDQENEAARADQAAGRGATRGEAKGEYGARER